MRLQNLIDIYERKSDCVVDWTHTSFCEGALDITHMLSYRSRVEQPSPLPLELCLSSIRPLCIWVMTILRTVEDAGA